MTTTQIPADKAIQDLLNLYQITGEDLQRVEVFGEILEPELESVVGRWYEWLETQPDFEVFFSDKEVLQRVQKAQLGYWRDFFAARVNAEYVENRRALGEQHARIGLSLDTYFAGMNTFMKVFYDFIASGKIDTAELAATVWSATKLLHLDSAIVANAYNQIIEHQLTAQSKSLMEMSTPVTQIWSGILLLPIVGIIDSKRATDIMHATLAKISETQARVFILDISGVGVVDTAVANNLIKITRATRLMGCECTISGVSPLIAQAIVDLGIDIGRVKTTATMKDALSDAFRRVGMEIAQAH